MLEGKNLTKEYNGRPVLSEISVSVAPGQALALLGPNGSGKSTLLSILSLSIRPEKGEVFVDGKQGKEAKKRIAYVPQDIVLFEELTAEENLKCWSSLPRTDTKARMEELMEILSMHSFRKKRVDRLSGGQRRRVNIAASMMSEPAYILLDEPFAGVDERTMEDLLTYLAKEKAEGKGIVICEHERETIRTLVDQVILLSEGEQKYNGNAAPFFDGGSVDG